MVNRRHAPIIFLISVVIVFSLIFLLPLSSLASPGLTVDTFGDTITPPLIQTGPGTNSTTADNPGILGGERDVVITITSGGGVLIVDTNTSKPSEYSHGQGPGVKGRSEITYDGNDSDASTLNATGLGGIDITDSGADTALVLIVTSDDYPAFLQVTLYTNATACSNVNMALPGGISSSESPKVFLFPYSSFTNVAAGCSSPVTVTSIGAIKILIDGTSNESTDITIDLVESAAVDFGDLPTALGPTNFTTTYATSGPGHVITSLYLGNNIDAESGSGAASPMGSSSMDDTTGSTPNDEDGISAAGTPWIEGADGGALNVTVTGGDGCLAGWIDWAEDGVANSAYTETDQILLNEPVIAGSQVVSFDIPSGALAAGWPASYYARYRLYPRDPDNTCTTTKSHKNQAYGGEVEDYYLGFDPTAVTINSLTARPTGTGYLPLGIAACILLLGLLLFLRRRSA